MAQRGSVKPYGEGSIPSFPTTATAVTRRENVVDILDMIFRQIFNQNHRVARQTRDVIADSMREIAAELDREVNASESLSVLHRLTSRVFIACQYVENKTEAVYVVTTGGNVIRVRVDAFEVEDALDAIAGDPDTDDVRAHIQNMIAELNARSTESGTVR